MSISKKFSILIITALAFLALGMGLFSSHSVEATMGEAQLQSVKNSVALGTLNVKSLHRSLFNWRIQEAKHTKENLQSIQALLRKIIEQDPSRTPEEIFNTFPLPEGLTLFAFDDTHSVTTQYGSPVAAFSSFADIKDIKGRNVASTMLKLAQKEKRATCLVTTDGGFKYFGSHRWVPEWNLAVGIWTDISKLQNKEQALFGALTQNLSTTLQTISIGKSGYVFVVDNAGKVIVPAPDMPAELSDIVNKETGTSLLQDLKNIAQAPGNAVTCSLALSEFSQNSGRKWVAYANTIAPLGWNVVGVAYMDEIQGPGQNLSLRLVFAMLGGTLLVTAGAILLSRKLTTPLKLLSKYAHEIPNKDFMQDEGQDPLLQQMASADSADEIRRLASSFLFMDTALRKRVKELMHTTAQKERLTGELNAARDIQMGLLPAPLTSEEMCNKAHIDAYLTPAKEVGGDLYDFFMLDDHRLCLVIGDVSDKGVPAALFMSITMTLIRSGARSHAHPAQLMETINNTLSKDNPKCMFVTLFIGILDLQTGTLEYANGGHNPALIYHAKDQSVSWLTPVSGPVVGAMEEMPYTPYSTVLEPGDTFFAYTDGVTEAMNNEKKLYSEEQLEKTFKEAVFNTLHAPTDIVDTVKFSVANHVAGADAYDDITMLCLRFDQAEEHASELHETYYEACL